MPEYHIHRWHQTPTNKVSDSQTIRIKLFFFDCWQWNECHMSVHVVRCVKWQRIIARTNGQLLRNLARALPPQKCHRKQNQNEMCQFLWITLSLVCEPVSAIHPYCRSINSDSCILRWHDIVSVCRACEWGGERVDKIHIRVGWMRATCPFAVYARRREWLPFLGPCMSCHCWWRWHRRWWWWWWW